MLESYFTVTSLNNYIKMVLEENENLRYLSLRAEISSFKKQYSTGHCYLTIKDEYSSMNAIMFAASAKSLTFEPKEGDDVLITGKVSSYPQRGQYQVYIYEMSLFGQGAQLLELERLKKQLQKEGLFDESRKRAINRYPTKVGVITGKGSAAAADIVKNLSRRYPLCEIIMFPSLVQGEGAPEDLLRAFNLSQQYDLTTLIIGRGGGSNEDLSAFNNENLVRAVANSKMPVISAVGHEVDTTLIDFVSDKRASTPTAAAEFACVDQEEIRMELVKSWQVMENILTNKLKVYKHRLDVIKANQFFNNPKTMYQDKLRDLKEYSNRLDSAVKNDIALKKQQIELSKKHLESLNPRSVLTRGFAIMEDENGNVLTSVNKIKKEQLITVALKDGKVISKVVETKEN